jgi:hypothetical protein
MGKFSAGRIGFAVRSDEIDLSRLGKLIALVDRTVRPSRRLCAD